MAGGRPHCGGRPCTGRLPGGRLPGGRCDGGRGVGFTPGPRWLRLRPRLELPGWPGLGALDRTRSRVRGLGTCRGFVPIARRCRPSSWPGRAGLAGLRLLRRSCACERVAACARQQVRLQKESSMEQPEDPVPSPSFPSQVLKNVARVAFHGGRQSRALDLLLGCSILATGLPGRRIRSSTLRRQRNPL